MTLTPNLCSALLMLASASLNAAPLLIAAPTTHAQPSATNDEQRFVGTVVDEEGEPIIGATVHFEGSQQAVGTNAKGEFHLPTHHRREAVLVVSLVGYETLREKVSLNTPKASARFVLRARQGEIGESVVTGSRTERLLKDVPVITRVIGRAEIERIAPADLPQLLQYTLPGIQFYYNTMSQTAALKYQGMNSKMLLFLIDGERMSGESSDHNIDFSRINPDDIERIEVVRGAASTLYDSNAQGGVINIITRRAQRPLALNFGSRVSNQGQQHSAQLGLRRNQFSSYTTLGYRQRNSYTTIDDKNLSIETRNEQGEVKDSVINSLRKVEMQGYTILDAAQRFTYTPTDKLHLEAKIAYYRNRRPDRDQGKRYDLYEDWAAHLRGSYELAKGQKIDLSYLLDDYQKHYFYPLAHERITPYRNLQQTLRLNYTAQFRHHTLSIGSEFEDEYLRHYMLADSGSVRGHRWSYYAQEEIDLLPQLKLVAGARLDKAYAYSLHLTPKVSLLYRPLEALTLRLNYSEGYRPPTLKERFQDFNMMGLMFIIGNPDLRPETSRQVSASVEWTRGGWSLSANSYHNRYRHYIAYQYIRANALKYFNTDNRRTTGLELSARYATPNYQLSATYNYVNDHDLINGYNVSNVRPHALTFGANYNYRLNRHVKFLAALNGHWGARFVSYLINRQDMSYEKYTYDARTYLSLNLGLHLPRRGTQINLIIDNLLDYRDKAGNATTQVPDAGRSLILSCRFNIGDLFGF